MFLEAYAVPFASRFLPGLLGFTPQSGDPTRITPGHRAPTSACCPACRFRRGRRAQLRTPAGSGRTQRNGTPSKRGVCRLSVSVSPDSFPKTRPETNRLPQPLVAGPLEKVRFCPPLPHPPASWQGRLGLSAMVLHGRPTLRPGGACPAKSTQRIARQSPSVLRGNDRAQRPGSASHLFCGDVAARRVR